ncbi:hypothetical protein ACLKA6_012604 [Drosophila palustris]
MGNTIFWPFAKPVEEAPLSTFDTFHFVAKSVLGVGTFFMPFAYVYAGSIGGILCTTLFTFLYIYGIHLMLQCMNEARDRNKSDDMTMSETVAFACDQGSKCCRPCSQIFGYLVDILLIIVHYSIGVMYLAFSAQNLKSIANAVWDNVDIRVFVAIVTICIIPLFLIRDVRYLSPLNITGNILIFIVIGYFISYRETINYLNKTTSVIFGKEIVNSDIHLYIGCVMFSLSSVGVMVTIESKMTKPEAYLGWWGTLNRAACFVFITNLIWGLYAYLRLGDMMYMPFLENSPMASLGELGKLCAAILVALTYPLNGFVAINIIFNQYIAKNRNLEHPVRVEIIVRVIFLLLTAIPALAFPSVFPAVQLVCAVALPLLNLIIPACTKLSLGYDSDKKWIWILLHILMIILGIGVLLCGLYSAYYDITILYLKKPMEKPFWDSAYDELLS